MYFPNQGIFFFMFQKRAAFFPNIRPVFKASRQNQRYISCPGGDTLFQFLFFLSGRKETRILFLLIFFFSYFSILLFATNVPFPTAEWRRATLIFFFSILGGKATCANSNPLFFLPRGNWPLKNGLCRGGVSTLPITKKGAGAGRAFCGQDYALFFLLAKNIWLFFLVFPFVLYYFRFFFADFFCFGDYIKGGGFSILKPPTPPLREGFALCPKILVITFFFRKKKPHCVFFCMFLFCFPNVFLPKKKNHYIFFFFFFPVYIAGHYRNNFFFFLSLENREMFPVAKIFQIFGNYQQYGPVFGAHFFFAKIFLRKGLFFHA